MSSETTRNQKERKKKETEKEKRRGTKGPTKVETRKKKKSKGTKEEREKKEESPWPQSARGYRFLSGSIFRYPALLFLLPYPMPDKRHQAYDDKKRGIVDKDVPVGTLG